MLARLAAESFERGELKAGLTRLHRLVIVLDPLTPMERMRALDHEHARWLTSAVNDYARDALRRCAATGDAWNWSEDRVRTCDGSLPDALFDPRVFNWSKHFVRERDDAVAALGSCAAIGRVLAAGDLAGASEVEQRAPCTLAQPKRRLEREWTAACAQRPDAPACAGRRVVSEAPDPLAQQKRRNCEEQATRELDKDGDWSSARPHLVGLQCAAHRDALAALVEARLPPPGCTALARLEQLLPRPGEAPIDGKLAAIFTPERHAAFASGCLAEARQHLASGDFERFAAAFGALVARDRRHGVDPTALLEELPAARRRHPQADGRAARGADLVILMRALADRAPYAAGIAQFLAGQNGYPSLPHDRAKPPTGYFNPLMTESDATWTTPGAKPPARPASHARVGVLGRLVIDVKFKDTSEPGSLEKVWKPATISRSFDIKTNQWVETTIPARYVTEQVSGTVRFEVRVVYRDPEIGWSHETGVMFAKGEQEQRKKVIEAWRLIRPLWVRAYVAHLLKRMAAATSPDARLEFAAEAFAAGDRSPEVLRVIEERLGKLQPHERWPAPTL